MRSRQSVPGWRVAVALALLTALVGVAGEVTAADDTLVWTTRSPMLSAGWCGAAAAGNGRVYYFGGGTLATTREYDPATDAWRTVANMPTGRYNLAGAAGPDGKLYAIGGWAPPWYTGATEAYDPLANTWEAKASMPTGRHELAAAAATNGIIYAIGGTYYMPYVPLNVVEAYNPATNTWTTLPPMPTRRWQLAAVGASNGKVYAIGGYGPANPAPLTGVYNTAEILNTLEEYDPATNSWTRKAPMPTARLALAAVATPDGRIYAIGGLNGTTSTDPSAYLATVEVYDTATDTWTTETPMPTPRGFHSVALLNGVTYAIGGYNGTLLATVEAAAVGAPQADTTTTVASSLNPSTYGESVAFTATVSAVPPGTRTPTGTVTFKDGPTVLGNAPLENVDGQQQATLSTSSLGVGGHSITAVYGGDSGALAWTGRSPMPNASNYPGVVAARNGRIYAIGGSNNVVFLSSVQEFDPATNTWTLKRPMPTARFALGVAEASNGKIYAIGGWNVWFKNAVEVYDPVSDTWESRAPLPTPRQGLAVVAAANGKIYAIGGNSIYFGPADGRVEEYDPATNSWAARKPMPTPRAFVTGALGSDGKIYVIGGAVGMTGGALATVEAYDPATDTWETRTPMPTARYCGGVAPAANGRIHAIGGYSNTYLATVEEYDPVADAWTAQTSLPSSRACSGVAVSDNKVYVIGGLSGSPANTPMNTVDEGRGTSSFNGSTSEALEQTVTKEISGLSLASSPNPSTFGGSVTLTATVLPSTATGTVQFQVDGTNLGSPVGLTAGVATLTASGLAAGDRGITAVYGGDDTFAGSTSPELTQRVDKALATVSLGNLSQTFNGAARAVTVLTDPASLVVSITYDGSATPPTHAGSYAVVVRVEDPNYEGVASGTLIVAKASQTITFGPLANKTAGDADFTVTANASSGLPVSFSAAGPCTVSGATVHLTGVGRCTITAHQAGNGDYFAAPDVPQSFDVIGGYDALTTLVSQLVAAPGVAQALLAKLDGARAAEAKGNANAKAGMIGAFINQVRAQTGKAISPENAAILISLAQAM